MSQLEERLRQLVQQACSHPAGSAERQKALTRIVQLVRPKLWKENTPYYQDALQQTWLYFCHNLCEGRTGECYNPDRGSIVTWLNFYLKRQLQQFQIKEQAQQAKTVSGAVQGRSNDADAPPDPVDNLPAPPDVPPLLDEVKRWVEADSSGELRRAKLANCPGLNCQALILRRLPPETNWKDLADDYNLPISTLSNFYQRQCMPRLRKFGESEGYL
jgi:hypothetical protein